MRRFRLALRAYGPHLALALVVAVLLAPVLWVIAALNEGRASGLDLLLAPRDGAGHSLVFLQTAWSAAVAAGTTVFAVVLGAPAGYACARLSFAGRRALLTVCVLALLAPASLVVAPEMLATSLLRLPESPAWVALAHASVALPAAVLLATAAYAGLPDELFLAAKLEGASPWQTFWQAATPGVRRSLYAIAAVIFAVSWGESAAAAALVGLPEASTLAAAHAALAKAGRPETSLAALGMLASAPAILAALLGGRRVAGLVFDAFAGPRRAED